MHLWISLELLWSLSQQDSRLDFNDILCSTSICSEFELRTFVSPLSWSHLVITLAIGLFSFVLTTVIFLSMWSKLSDLINDQHCENGKQLRQITSWAKPVDFTPFVLPPDYGRDSFIDAGSRTATRWDEPNSGTPRSQSHRSHSQRNHQSYHCSKRRQLNLIPGHPVLQNWVISAREKYPKPSVCYFFFTDLEFLMSLCWICQQRTVILNVHS